MRAKQKFKLSATIIGICFLLHGIPVFAAESSEMIEFDLKTNEMKTVEIEEDVYKRQLKVIMLIRLMKS